MADARGQVRWSRSRDRLIGLPLVVFTTYAVLFGGSFFGIYLPSLRILTLSVVVVVLSCWGAWMVQHSDWRPRTQLWPAYGAALLAFTIGEFFARSTRIGLEYLAWSILLVALYLLMVQLFRHRSTDRVLSAVLVAALVVICASYLALTLRSWFQLWSLVGLSTPPLRPLSEGLTYGNPSAVMTIAVLLLGWTVAHIGLNSPRRRFVIIVLTFAVLAVVALSGSRSGWLALSVAIGCVGTSWFVGRVRRAGALQLRGTPRRTQVLGGIAVLVGVVILTPAIAERFNAGGEELRASYWIAAARMFAASPLVGLGPGSWVADRILFTYPPETDYYIPHAHDLYVQTAAEFGLTGVAAGVVAVVVLLRLIIPVLRDADPVRRRYAWVALFGVVYFGAHQLLDIYANMPATLIAFVAPIAWLDASAATGDRQTRALRPRIRGGRVVAGAAAIALLGTAVATLAWAERSALALDQAVSQLDLGNPEAALLAARAATSADPSLPVNQYVLGLASAYRSPSEAAQAFQRAAASDGFPVAWLDLAAIRHQQRDDAAARVALAEALRLGNQQPGITFAAADLELRMGDDDSAIDLFSSTLVNMPTLAGDRYWTATAGIARIWPAILTRVLQSPARLIVLLELGRTGEAMQTASSAGIVQDRNTSALLVAGWQGDRTALARLGALASSHLLEASIPSWLAILYDRMGDHETADRYRTRADLVSVGSAVAAHEVRVLGPGVTGWIAGMSGQYYGQYTYRRRTPNEQLVPALPQLVYADTRSRA